MRSYIGLFTSIVLNWLSPSLVNLTIMSSVPTLLINGSPFLYDVSNRSITLVGMIDCLCRLPTKLVVMA